MKILVSTISYVNSTKQGSEIYTTFAKRLVNDVITKTPFDIFVNTNRKDLFEEVNNNIRVTIRDSYLRDHLTHVGAFNQLLKFSAIKDIPSSYDWVIYLDCDAGFTCNVDFEVIKSYLTDLEQKNIEMVALRTNATYKDCLNQYLDSTFNNTDHTFTKKDKTLFNDKFVFYGINENLIGSKFPSEHIYVVKNNQKLQKMSAEFENLCYKFETQNVLHPVTFDMEAYEIGVSAFLAGYDMQELGWNNQIEIFKVGFNYNNFEKIKV